MMDFGHYLAKNHARKIPIEPKYTPGLRAGSWRVFWFDGNFSSMIFG
jgi:hypothetical protein